MDSYFKNLHFFIVLELKFFFSSNLISLFLILPMVLVLQLHQILNFFFLQCHMINRLLFNNQYSRLMYFLKIK